MTLGGVGSFPTRGRPPCGHHWSTCAPRKRPQNEIESALFELKNAIQAHLVRWDDLRGRYVLTGTGRRRTVEGSRGAGTVVSFRKRGIVGGGPLHRKSANLKE
jgi:hypothetical protein